MSLATRYSDAEGWAAEILAFAGDGVIVTDEDGRILLFNRTAEEIFGHAADDVLGLPVEILMPERFRRAHREQVRLFARGVGPAHRVMGQHPEVMGRREDGSEFAVEATLARHDIDGQAVLIAIVRDVSEREQAHERERLIVQELEHRVKNILATVQALVVQTLHGSSSLEDFVNAFSHRLVALADIHTLLGQSRWQGASLRELVLRQLAVYDSAERQNIVVRGEPVVLEPAAALALNLALHELATNAAKYGALSVPEGGVEVRWCVGDGPEARRLVLAWAEHGGPEVRPPERRGFGCRLIERSIAHELGGSTRLEFPPQGVRCRIELPLAADAETKPDRLTGDRRRSV